MLAEALEILCRGVSADERVRAALVAEKAEALGRGQLGEVSVLRAGEAVAVLVVRPGGARAVLLGMHPVTGGRAAELSEHVARRLAAQGVSRLVWGGPPGCYLTSGVAAREREVLAFWQARGWAALSRHVDLEATPGAPGAMDARVRRAGPEEREAVVAWVRCEFLEAWAQEVARAFGHGAVWVAGAPGAYEGFAAHSGNNAALGTFGPVGVLEARRGGGLGAALTQAALDDLAARGFATVTIPWVDPKLEGFYRARVKKLAVIERVMLVRELR